MPGVDLNTRAGGRHARVTSDEVVQKLRGATPGVIRTHAVRVEGVLYPIHPLQVTAMGMLAADSLQLEDLATACAEEGRFEFMAVGLPLRLPGGTGSPWNPIAIF